MVQWRPPAGTMALVEPLEPEAGHEALTATVLDDERLLLDLGASPRPPPSADVVASFFTPEAMLRATGLLLAVGEDGGLFELVVKELERVQRRRAHRTSIELEVAMAAPDAVGPVVCVRGRTHNVSAGGCRVRTDRPLPAGTDPLVTLEIPGDAPVIAQATVLATNRDGETWDYRLMFTAIDASDRDRLDRL